jgi:hypothetical protein
MKSLNSRLVLSRVVGVAFCALIFVASVWVRDHWIIDDALIFQNYVRSFLAGDGLVYGPGNSAEGYSSPLWVLVLSAAGGLGAKGFLAAKAISTALGLASVVLVAGFLPPKVDLRASVVAGTLVALQPALAWWSVSGMETSLVAFLLTCTFFGFVYRRVWLVGVVAGLLAISRPEAPMYTAVALGWLYVLYRQDEVTRRQWLGATMISVLPWFGWEIFRFCYYGAFIANSALAKLGTGAFVAQSSSLKGAWLYMAESFFRLGSFWLAVAVATAVFIKAQRDDEHASTAVAVGSLVYITVLFILVVGGDWMPWSRFLTPLVPLGFGWAALAWQQSSASGRRVLASVSAFILLWSLSLQQRDFLPSYSIHLPSQHTVVAKFPDERLPFIDPVLADPVAHFYAAMALRFTEPGDTVFHADIGQPGYLTHDLEVMDAFGLVSRFEAEYLHARHNETDLVAHFRKENPSLVFLVIQPSGNPAMVIAQPLVEELQERYSPVARAPWSGGHEMLVLVRQDALERVVKARRYERWMDSTTGLLFISEVVLQLARSVEVEESPTLANADRLSVHEIQRMIAR